jgi:hypothetical protein
MKEAYTLRQEEEGSKAGGRLPPRIGSICTNPAQ